MGWARRGTGRRATGHGGGGGRATATPDPARTAERAPADNVIDLRDGAAWMARLEHDSPQLAAMAERRRERVALAEAQRDLRRLRARHWSGERIIEEGRVDIEWWEHPDADPYAVLGLLPGAPLHAAATARRKIALASHPDCTGVQDADEVALAMRRMVAANAAYDRLRRALRTS